MKQARRRKEGKSGLDLVEEATHLLRTAPAATLAVYYLGTIPFVLSLLFFWSDMSRSPFASQHLAEGALGVTAAFLWMKCCQAAFARRIRAQISGEPPAPWNFRQGARLVLSQAIVQPSGLFVLPLALLFVVPFPWVYAFYQNATVLADGQPAEKTKLLRNSWKHAALWPAQNVIFLVILSGFAFYVYVDWVAVCLSVPQLLKMLFGIESDFTRSSGSLVNPTFFMAMFVVTWLCLDPILKVFYTLRCFYGESLSSGRDVSAELKQFVASVRPLAAAAVVFMVMAGAPSVHGAEAPPPAVVPGNPQVSPGVSPPDLDRAIDQTIHQRKFTWRMPRENVAPPEGEKGAITRFLEKIANLIRSWVKAALTWISELMEKLFRRNRPVGSSGSSSGYGWILALQILFYVLIAAVIVALLVLVYRIWRGSMPAAAAVATEPLQPVPDLTDENVGADQLPEDGWTRLARELLERGEFRLALRAFYLASLAHLAQRNLISLARFKSNREYSVELGRRGHSFPELHTVFGDNLSVFERIWYGVHEVNRDVVDRFAANVERIRAGG